MTCDELNPLLNARIDDEIDPVQRSALDSHVKTCSACAADLLELESVRNAIRADMPYYTASADLRNQVRSALRGAEYLDRGARRTGWRVWGAIAASVALCALVTAPFFVNARSQRQFVAEELLSAHQRALIGRAWTSFRRTSTRSSMVQREAPVLATCYRPSYRRVST